MINFPLKPKLASYAKGVNILHLTNNDIRNLCLPVPDVSEQKRIVDKLDALFINVEKAKKIAEQQIADLDELKQAILKKAFNGEL
jgi:restriction endonuclease S subunit